MNSSEFDQRFDAGDSVIEALDLTAARRPRQEQKRVNVDFPVWMVEQLDLESGLREHLRAAGPRCPRDPGAGGAVDGRD
ncbi:MAG: type II toxin-antitoxin system BrnA family antitoxin [Cyanobium sp.]|jgi:hypothetical protein